MTALVPGELRGYRQFDLDGGLRPLVHGANGPWDAVLERAVCAKGLDHAPPQADCTCGLYTTYRPGSGTVSIGAANAVIRARGRCVLGDRGFRAASARIEAALPLTHLHRARGRPAAGGLLLLPRNRAAELAADWWPLLVLLVLAVQAGFIWLLTRLMALQLPGERL